MPLATAGNEQADCTPAGEDSPWASSPSSPRSQVEPHTANLLGQPTQHQRLRALISPDPDPPDEGIINEDMATKQEEEASISTASTSFSTIGPQQYQQGQSYEKPAYLNRIEPRNPNGSTMEERLQMMPEKREMPWRPGIQPGSEYETGGDSRRKQIRFGCLLATRGDIAKVPCSTCANGRGKFSVCVSLEGFFKGACASCQLSGRPTRCSNKQDDDGKPDLQSPALTQVSDDAAPAPSARPSAHAVATGIPPTLNTSLSEGTGLNPPLTSSAPEDRIPLNVIIGGLPHATGPTPMKRIRIDDGGSQLQQRYDMDRPQWQQELGHSQARQPIGTECPWPAIGKPPYSAPAMPGPLPVRMLPNNTIGGRDGRPAPTMQGTPPAAGSARLNPLDWPRYNSFPRLSVGGMKERPSSSDANGRGPWEQGTKRDREDDEDAASATRPLIETLSRAKQRQIYGLVNGLQGSIDHLHWELESLKRAIGIDDSA